MQINVLFIFLLYIYIFVYECVFIFVIIVVCLFMAYLKMLSYLENIYKCLKITVPNFHEKATMEKCS